MRLCEKVILSDDEKAILNSHNRKRLCEKAILRSEKSIIREVILRSVRSEKAIIIGKTLERYQRCSFTSQNDNDNEHETQNWYQEMSKLKAKYESLQKSQRQLLGEDLGPLNIKELQNLEKQLEGALAQARQRKTQIMIEQMEEFRKKELHLGEINKQLRFKLESDGFNLKAYDSMWNSNNSATVAGGSNFPFQHSENNPMDCQAEPFLYQNYVQAEQSSAPKNMVGETSFIQGWML
ncbi:Agamous-like MADS-box protein mads3 [Trifolium repens]|nr:Agamous-like MADS-box protein mads3 [Trifolium repens]